jgi:uncharacterized protein YndB with AHSA1/START domain
MTFTMEKYITLTKTITASRERVWEAWVNQDQVQQWWAPNGFTNPVCEVDARVGGELSIVMLAGDGMGSMSGMKAPMKGVFTEVVENEKLVFTNIALDDNGNHLLEGLTTVAFEDLEGNTKLTVHTGAGGTAPGVEQMLGGMETGWNQQLEKLSKFLNS